MIEKKMLENIIHCLKVGADLAVCEDCNLYPCDHSNVEDLARVAIKAVDKQIPKIVIRDGYDEGDDVCCPCCETYIGANEYVWDDFYNREWKPIYCQECGQAMIWE